MNELFFLPVAQELLDQQHHLAQQTLGNKIKIHTKTLGFPDLSTVNIAILGVLDNRNSNTQAILHFNQVRKAFYSLYLGRWSTTLADLGDIAPGETINDTYFAVKTAIHELLKQNIIPIIIGGSHDISYANYRAYDGIVDMVNLVCVDSKFNLGDSNQPISNKNFVGKIILEEPYNLFNYATIGYQTYFNAQEEIDILEKLYFETYRLGEITKNITIAEPVLRDAHIVSIDLSVMRSADVSELLKISPNGLRGNEVCTIARYAGISNKVTSFGIYEYVPSANDTESSMLMAQIIWYFIEGVNSRINDEDFTNQVNYQKYITLVNDQELIFYKSAISNRWWLEIPFLSQTNNISKIKALLPCVHQDYLDACNNVLPERWFKAFKKSCV